MDVWKVVFEKITDPTALVALAMVVWLLRQNSKITEKYIEQNTTLTKLATLLELIFEEVCGDKN